jgi:hypothetical protein
MIRRTVMVAALAACVAAGCGQPAQGSLKEVQRAHAGTLDVVLLSTAAALPQGKGFAVLEFRSSNGSLVNVGTVRVNATMPMAGMAPMIGGSEVTPTPAPGRYELATDLGMAGTWRFAVEWDGPAGKGSALLAGTAH